MPTSSSGCAAELGQPRNHEIARECVRQIDAQAAAQAGRGGLEHRLHLLGIGEQFLAALEELLALVG